MSQFKRISSLDGLRAVSIIMVLASHATLTSEFPDSLAFIFSRVFSGYLGVQCFFVISGFLITSLLLKEEAAFKSVSLRSFYIRRVLRIMPVYFLYIIVLWIWDCSTDTFSIPPSTYIAAATFTTGLWGVGSWLLGHTWSLAVEEQFYLLWPATFVFFNVRTRLLIAWGFILIVPILRIAVHFSSYQGVFSYLFVTQGDSIMFGCVLAICLAQWRNKTESVFAYKPILFRLLALFIIYFTLFLSGRGLLGFINLPLGGSIRAIALVYLVGSFMLIQTGMVHSILNATVMKWIGVLSYSLYIWQEAILYPAGNLWWQKFPQNLGVVFVVATISYYSIEKQFLKIKDRFKII